MVNVTSFPDITFILYSFRDLARGLHLNVLGATKLRHSRLDDHQRMQRTSNDIEIRLKEFVFSLQHTIAHRWLGVYNLNVAV